MRASIIAALGCAFLPFAARSNSRKSCTMASKHSALIHRCICWYTVSHGGRSPGKYSPRTARSGKLANAVEQLAKVYFLWPASSASRPNKAATRPIPHPKRRRGKICGTYTTNLPHSFITRFKIQNEFKGDAKIQIDAPKIQNEVDAPYISSSLFSLPDSLHAADGASPAINSDPKGEGDAASGDGEIGEAFDPLMAIWNVAIGVLANTPGIKLPTLETHLKLLRVVSISPTGEVVLGAPNQFTREWVKDRYLSEVKAALIEATGVACVSVQIVVATK